MYISQSSIKLVCAVALSALLVSAAPGHSFPLTLHGTNDGDLGPDYSKAEVYRTATLVQRLGRASDSEWEVTGGWYRYRFAIARQLENHQTWLREVENRNEDLTLIAAGYDEATPPEWWVIISEGVDAERWSESD